MTSIDDLSREPWRFDFFDTLRRLERQFGRPIEADPGRSDDRAARPALPRIGDAASRREEYVLLGQDPYFDFPASNLSSFVEKSDCKYAILVKFLGLLGPNGALPLATTEEAWRWMLARDDAFPRFLDIFNHRFLQLFFRAWADARPAAQHDRPAEDRFIAYVGSAIGLGSPIFAGLDTIADSGKLGIAGLIGSKVKSASRLRGAIRALFKTAAEIEQFVGTRLELAPEDRTRLGAALCGLGVDTMIGGVFYSVQDKIRVRLFVADMEDYARFLPEGRLCEPLVDLVYFMFGDEIDWDVELSIPAHAAPPMRLGVATRLGWTSWLAPDPGADGRFSDARFNAADRIRRKREGNRESGAAV
ncbi:type VI secretion system baseplate subunit TssG [Rhodoblastus acidophilus]|uniref:Type VI secretion system baseplate subunit TssG n=1 Tax=Candidatus Rhodoblastus alkanivorans TaxID=2954117 RepID=A0ABS9Z7A1_9HYPH|nr:type VI secretion system baseplate subunit TssG [Candidatus Rhodoblastus alkanivorans]MCI4678270.1 type VI secretion system baseplate subunit TssG [Candidatus Rhodoblastus alkanivorans]MCI4683528.1 type VI secretion system baseplate subunit TssG [Candidatus Rhodoblastus alkanivorans]MDI4640843.1 type VI secretion system baseplate subunit TssG [Rhodoblastus acidophilus]